MRLSELLLALPPELAATETPDPDPIVRGVSYDSRAVSAGDLFVALRGEQRDGHDYLDMARAQGAVAFLLEDAASGAGLPAVVVPDTRRALAPVAARFYGDPAYELRLIGITGTNGKTSTTCLVDAILRAADVPSGVIGTLGLRFRDTAQPGVNTTPESLDLQRILRTLCTEGVRAVSMEVSSHGLAMGRVGGVEFEVAAFTNLTQDHLDYHGTMEAYGDAKALLFRDHLGPDSTAVINVDDPAAPRFLEAAEQSGARVLRTSRTGLQAEVRVERADVRADGTRAVLALPTGPLPVRLPLLGEFNVENLAVAAGVAVALGIDPEAIAQGIETCPQVPGRTERVGQDLPGTPTVLVDYAHTPDAVEKLMRSIRPLAKGRLIALFGCGGDRDRGKRPQMAAAVARFADRTIATSDNPRTEDPEAILTDVEAGLTELDRVEPDALDITAGAYARVADRREAIRLAISIARPEDTVVLAGKGHEDYQIIGREKLPFDDRLEALRALRDEADPS